MAFHRLSSEGQGSVHTIMDGLGNGDRVLGTMVFEDGMVLGIGRRG